MNAVQAIFAHSFDKIRTSRPMVCIKIYTVTTILTNVVINNVKTIFTEKNNPCTVWHFVDVIIPCLQLTGWTTYKSDDSRLHAFNELFDLFVCSLRSTTVTRSLNCSPFRAWISSTILKLFKVDIVYSHCDFDDMLHTV